MLIRKKTNEKTNNMDGESVNSLLIIDMSALVWYTDFRILFEIVTKKSKKNCVVSKLLPSQACTQITIYYYGDSYTSMFIATPFTETGKWNQFTFITKDK